MKRFSLLCFLMTAAFSAVFTQKLIDGGKPRAAAKTENRESYFVKFPQGVEVYKIRDTGGDDRKDFFEIKKQGKKLGTINADINAFGGTTDNFFAFYGDLDKNKSKELIVVDFNGSGNGLGVNFYTVSIFPDFETKGFAAPLTFNDSEFGRDGTFIYDAKKNETLILITEWGGVEIKDPKRGSGLYFTGKFFRYAGGRLAPANDKPILARRYLNSFEKERFRTDSDPRRPYLWLTSPAAIKLSAEPIFSVKPATSQSGVVEKYENFSDSFKDGEETKKVTIDQIVVRLDSGEKKTVILLKNPDYVDLPGDAGKIMPEDFGFLASKITLPSDLSPLYFFDDLRGKKVQLNSYVNEQGAPPIYRLWFVE